MLYTHVLHVYAIHIAHIYMCPGLTTLDWTNYVGVRLWVKKWILPLSEAGDVISTVTLACQLVQKLA